jgi:hypothetical protein
MKSFEAVGDDGVRACKQVAGHCFQLRAFPTWCSYNFVKVPKSSIVGQNCQTIDSRFTVIHPSRKPTDGQRIRDAWAFQIFVMPVFPAIDHSPSGDQLFIN